MLTADFQEI